MSFAFANPGALWLLPAVALPIVFHLFFRLKRQVQDFPSLMFFIRIDPKLSAKRKIHEWLILFLRCLIIALVILALARPTSDIGGGAGVARIILLDNSASMASPVSSPKIELAARAAEKLFLVAQSGDSISVQLMIQDGARPFPQNFNADAAEVKNALHTLSSTEGEAPVAKSVRAALAVLATAKQPQRELHIITDLSKGDWGRGEIEAQAAEASTRVIVHMIESKPISSGFVTLAPLQTPHQAIPSGRIFPVRLELKNYGKGAAVVRLNSIDDSGKNVSKDFSIPPNEAMPATLTFSFSSPGFHWAQVWLDGDAALSGSRVSLGFWCVEAQKVLLIGGKERFGAFPLALAPGGNADISGIVTVPVAPDKVASELASKPLAVAMAWEDVWDSSASQALQKYVREGGVLFIMPSPEGGVGTGNTLPWLGISPNPFFKMAAPESFIPLQVGDEVWRDMRDSDGKVKLGTVKLFQARPLKESKEWEPLVSSSGGQLLFAQRKMGQGRIYASGVAFLPAWSTIPLKAGFVVMMQNTLFAWREDRLPVEQIKAGGDIRFDLPTEQASVQSLTEEPLQWQGMPVKFSGLARSGVYEIHQKDRSKWVAIHAAADDCAPEYFSGKEIPVLKNIPYQSSILENEEDIVRADLLKRLGSSLYQWLIVAALLALLLETCLANERMGTLGRKLIESISASLSLKKEGHA